MANFDELLNAQASVSPAKNTKKFNIKEFAAKDAARLMLNCIMHQNGRKIATDTYNLIAIDSKYPSELEGVCTMAHKLKKTEYSKEYAEDEVVEGKYPNWENCIPVNGVDYAIDLNKCLDLVYDTIKEAKASFKKNNPTRYYESAKDLVNTTRVLVRFKDADQDDIITEYNINTFYKFLLSMKALGTNIVRYCGKHRGLVAMSKTGIALAMPLYNDGFDKDNYFINETGRPYFFDGYAPVCVIDTTEP